MTNAHEPQDDLLQLLSALADGGLDDHQREQLAELLDTSPEARDAYFEFAAFQTALRHEATRELAVGDPAADAKHPPAPGQSAHEQEKGRNFLRRRRLASAVAAVALSVAVLAGWAIRDGWWSGSPAGDPLGSVPAGPIAKVVRAVDAKWPAGATALSPGDELTAGQQVSLGEGLLEIELDNGIRTILFAPATLRLESGQATELVRGKMVANVPAESVGFAVTTPSTTVVDLGTEFGVDVSNTGATEVHVFEGRVSVRPIDESLSPRLLTVGKALRVDPTASVPIAPIEIRTQDFIGGTRLTDSEPTAPHPPVTRQLVLRLAADAGVECDAQGRVVVWRDALTGDNRSPDDARQQDPDGRPRWVARATNGRPAVRFDGKATSLAVESMSTGDDLTLFVVFARQRKPFGSDPESLLWDTAGTPALRFSALADGIMRAEVRNGVGPKASSGDMFSSPVETGVPQVIGYVYSRSENWTELRVNGVSTEVHAAVAPAAVVAPRSIGCADGDRGFFRGDVAELLLYDTGLTPAELNRVEHYLVKKYR